MLANNPIPLCTVAIALCALFVYLLPRFYRKRSIQLFSGAIEIPVVGRPRVVLLQTFLALLYLIVLFMIAQEYYYHVYSCSTSVSYNQINTAILRRFWGTMQAIKAPVWADFGTLLAVLRKHGITSWDDDSDFSTIWIDDHSLSIIVESLAHPSIGLKSYWYPAQQRLIVTFPDIDPSSGPHLNLWFWTDSINSEGTRILSSPSNPISALTTRPFYSIFPLQDIEWDHASVIPSHGTISIPHHSHFIAVQEYTHYGGSYMEPKVYRSSCMDNMLSLRWLSMDIPQVALSELTPPSV